MGSKLRRLRIQAGLAGEALRRQQDKEWFDRYLASQAERREARSSESRPIAQAAPAPAKIFDAESIDLKIAGASIPQVIDPPRPPAAGMRLTRRLPLLQQALVVSMLLGLASSPKGDR
jgi:hypothetical protein